MNYNAVLAYAILVLTLSQHQAAKKPAGQLVSSVQGSLWLVLTLTQQFAAKKPARQLESSVQGTLWLSLALHTLGHALKSMKQGPKWKGLEATIILYSKLSTTESHLGPGTEQWPGALTSSIWICPTSETINSESHLDA